MRITTRGRYGLRAMVDLAQHHGNGPVMMRAITERQQIPRKYLHSLLAALRRQELVHSLRGSRGGFVLARDPEQITARDVLEALEGRISLVDCAARKGQCKLYGVCPTRGVWEDLSHLVSNRLGEMTLADLANGKTPGASKPD